MNDSNSSSQTHWIPLSDLMTGLMMVFMLLTALFLLRVEQTTTLIVQEYETTKEDLLRALQDTFKEDLKEWDAEFLGDMTLRFNNPDVLFSVGSAQLKIEFKEILTEFIPRYLEILQSTKFQNTIVEIRIEGHTSTFWKNEPESIAYIKNMELSQSRTRSVLTYILNLSELRENRAWIRSRITANGLSSSRPIRKSDNTIDELASQRVEFRLVTNAEEKIENIAKNLIAND